MVLDFDGDRLAARAVDREGKEIDAFTLDRTTRSVLERKRGLQRSVIRSSAGEGTERVAVIAWGFDPAEVLPELGLVRDDTVLESTDAKLAAFGFTAAELDTVPRGRRHELVFERMALVDVLRR